MGAKVDLAQIVIGDPTKNLLPTLLQIFLTVGLLFIDVPRHSIGDLTTDSPDMIFGKKKLHDQ